MTNFTIERGGGLKPSVIKNIKENPKMFYDYIRNQRYKDSKIGPFKIENEYVYDTKEICKILIEQ